MASGEDWDAEKILELYLHNYMMKRKMHKTAAIFKKEANVCDNPVVIDSAEGFLDEWWSIFYDVFASRQLMNHQQACLADTLVQAQQMTENVQQNIYPTMPELAMPQQRPGQFPVITDFDKMLGQPSACLLAAKMYEEDRLSNPARSFDPNLGLNLIDVNTLNLSNSAATISSRPQQQIRKQAQPQAVRDNRSGISLERTLPMDPTLLGVPKTIVPITGPHDTGMNEVINPAPLNGWPLTVLNSNFRAPDSWKQFLMLTEESHQALLGQVLSCTPGNQTSIFPGSPASFVSQNPMLPKSELSGNDVQSGRKWKTRSYSRARDKTLDSINANSKHVDENVESFLSHNDENAGDTSTPLGSLKRRFSACNEDEHKGFTFEEVGSHSVSNNKVLCCHFSSDGKFLASAGHEKKVLIWNMESLDFIDTSEGHSLLITDVRFRPSSTIFATSSFDRTVKIWDAARPRKSLYKFLGHAEQVMSVDFHPRKLDLLCSCDANNEIRLWNVNQFACTRVSKGATKQVRFQPRFGQYLATAAGNGIHVIDVETDSLQFYLKGHVKDVLSICWDSSGNYIASVSEDSVRLWSTVSGGKCVHELRSNGNKFQSCTFHPGYSQLLIIGGYQSLELWNPTAKNKTWSVPAHKGLVAALANSRKTEMVASASHDHFVKLWK